VEDQRGLEAAVGEEQRLAGELGEVIAQAHDDHAFRWRRLRQGMAPASQAVGALAQSRASAMHDDSHRSTSQQLAGTAGRTSYAGGYWRYYAWRFI
jgi:hypothetical protein